MATGNVAICLGASDLYLFTDVNGLRGKIDDESTLIKIIGKVDDHVLKYAKQGDIKSYGLGGMFSKLKSAKDSTKKGITTHIAHVDDLERILLYGQHLHTICLPQ